MLFKNKKNNLEQEQIMKDFAEGRISTYEFWKELNNNEKLRNIIFNDKKLPIKNHPFLYDNLNINILYHRCEIFRVVKVYFLRRNINLNFYNKDSELYSALLNIVPSYVDISQWFLDNILGSCLYDFNTTNWKKYIKDQTKINYKFEKYAPKWLQEEEWPIVDNEPTIFIKQDIFPDNMKSDDIEICYYFKDKNGKEIVVKQYT